MHESTSNSDLPQRFADALLSRYGQQPVAILLYGSWLRGKRDTVLDFYVLFDQYRDITPRWHGLVNRILPPNVYNVAIDHDGRRESAKFATLTLSHLEKALSDDFDSYFWARWTQPFETLYTRDAAIGARVAALADVACKRLIAETLPALPEHFTTAELWTTAFSLTYGCELRSESGDRAAHLADAYRDWLAHRTAAAADDSGLRAGARDSWRQRCNRREGWFRARWSLRRVVGKSLSAARLLKAVLTFDDPLDYVLWKVERHSGIREHASPRQRRYPLLFAWPVLWRLYRRGGFR